MVEINEIKLPKGVEIKSVTTQDDGKIVIEFIPKKSKFKEGDFVYEDGRIMIVKSYPSNYHANAYPKHSNIVCYNDWYGVDFSSPTFRHAADEERQILIDAMRKDGKRWNDNERCVEDIPKPKFKAGDKVKIKYGISSKTHSRVSPGFTRNMDEFIGKELTVKRYTDAGNVVFYEDDWEYYFAEDWLEPWRDEPKKGDLAIFWDDDYEASSVIRIYGRKGNEYHCDNSDSCWDNAIKFESKEQFEKVLRGEI